MTGILEIEEMEFFAYHGCFEAEQTVGNKFKVYACLHYNCDKAAVSDQITDALSYQTAYEIIAVEMMKRSHLLEHVGLRMLDALYAAFPQLLYAKILEVDENILSLHRKIATGSVGRAVRQRSAKPCTAVQICYRPQKPSKVIFRRLFCIRYLEG